MRARRLPAARPLSFATVAVAVLFLLLLLLLLLLGSAPRVHAGRESQGSGTTAGAQAAAVELLRVRVANLYAAADTSRDDAVLLSSTFYSLGRALAELGELVASSATENARETAAFEALSLYSDALHYFEQAGRVQFEDETLGADGAPAQNLKVKATALQKALLQRHRSAFQQRAQDDGFKVGDVLYAFTKRQAGAKSAVSQKVKLLKTKGGVAGKVFVQLQSGRRSKQKVPYTWLRRHQRFLMPIPRLTTTELLDSPHLLRGHEPFIITDALASWPAMQRWKSLDYLDAALPDEWVDFYPQNMYELGNKPWVMPSPQAMSRFKSIEPELDESGLPRYMQYRLSLDGWRRLERDLFPNFTAPDSASFGGRAQRQRYLPPVMWTEADWIECFGSDEAADNFYRTNQWNMLLIGEIGTGIFFHHDHLAAASWSAQVVGRKTWVVCPYNQSHLLNNDIHTFDPDYERFPQFADAICGKTTVEAGELMYYPAYWWHQTKCLDRPTIGITGLMVGIESNRDDVGDREGMVHRQFLRDMQQKCAKCWPTDLTQCKGDFEKCRKCDDISLKWPGAAPPVSHDMCAALPQCYELWDAHFRQLDFEGVSARRTEL